MQRYRDGSPRETLRGGRKATKHGTESDRLENAAVICSVIFRRPVSTHEVLRCTVQYNTEMKEESTAVGPQRLHRAHAVDGKQPVVVVVAVMEWWGRPSTSGQTVLRVLAR